MRGCKPVLLPALLAPSTTPFSGDFAGPRVDSATTGPRQEEQ
jgi:hypothetical protein